LLLEAAGREHRDVSAAEPEGDKERKERKKGRA